MDATILTIAGTAGVAALSGLAWLAFQHPALYVERFSSAALAGPLLYLAGRSLWAWGYLAGGGKPIDLFVDMVAVGCAVVFVLLLRWVAYISPHRPDPLD